MNEEQLRVKLEAALTKKGELHKELIKTKRLAEVYEGHSVDELFSMTLDIEVADAMVLRAWHGISNIKKEFAEAEASKELED